MDPDSDREFTYDVRRSVLLGRFIQQWGMPSVRRRFTRTKPDDLVEVYWFPEDSEGKIARVVTVGASAGNAKAGMSSCEFLLVLPYDLGGAAFSDVAGFLMDFVLYSRQSDVLLREGYATPDSELVPNAWPMKSIVVSTPRGEPEEMESFHVGTHHVNLWWLIPMYRSESDFVLRHGLAAFDSATSESDVSLVETRRPPLL